MRLLGVDPGSHKTGWGILEVEEHGPSTSRGRIAHVDNGVLFLDDSRDLTVRLVDLSHRLRDVITRYRPDCAAVEDVFVQKGARSALILGQARGAALATLGLAGLSVRSIPTSQVKLRVTGQGRADKAQVAEMVRVLLGLKEVPFEDAADALAVAISVAGELGPAVPATGSRADVVTLAARASVPAASARKGKSRDALLALAKAQGKA